MARQRPRPGSTVQAHIPGLARSDKVARPLKVTEKVLQQHTRQILGNLGYASAEVGAARKQVTCPCCSHRFFPDGWQGNSEGYPDLSFFRYTDDFPPVGILVELKTADGKPTHVQQAFANAGRSQIAYGIHDVIGAIIKAEDALTAYQTPTGRSELLRRYLIENKGKI